MNYQDVFLYVLGKMMAEDIPFVVGGGYAVNAFTGIRKPTKDLDLLFVPAKVPQVLEALEEFEIDASEGYWLNKIVQGDAQIDLIHRFRNQQAEIEDWWIRKGVAGKFFGYPVLYAPPEGMIFIKIFIMEKFRFDGSDIANIIINTHRLIDWDFLLHITHKHYELLLMNLLFFRYVYPQDANLVPQSVINKLFQRINSYQGMKPSCNGALIDRWTRWAK